ncbi:MAG: XdhC family protein [Albidovulum sp.]
MTILTTTRSPTLDPLHALLSRDAEGVIAIIAGVEGPSYRPVGAIMAVFSETERVGTLSSGCIEADIALHAVRARALGHPVMLRYGRGSPFADIQLPCGGGLDILLVPAPDRSTLAQVVQSRSARRSITLNIDIQTGAMTTSETGETGCHNGMLHLRFIPDVQFLVFGKGPEASTFAALVEAAGYPNILFSPDLETLQDGEAKGSTTRHLIDQAFPDDVVVDERTAVLLFFHDHDWEPPVLLGALNTPAFYIGAQGSQRARDDRLMSLRSLGAAEPDIARLRGPIGLVPSARDAGTLAVSVLAEVLGIAMQQSA